MEQDEFSPIAPGQILKEEFLADFNMSQSELARAIGISPNRIAGPIHTRRRMTADTAIRLSLYFGNSPGFWINLQTRYDPKMARQALPPAEVGRIQSLRAA